jgi:S1-C subfamily serine protease
MTPPATLGIAVQELTKPLASLTGASVGVVVTWVERDGPASQQVKVGDVIESIDGRRVSTRLHWDVQLARLSADETVSLRVRRRHEVQDVVLAATPAGEPAVRRPPSLGLTLRGLVGVGAEVVGVEPSAVGGRAGLAVGDVITLVGDVAAPTPAQVRRSFGSGQDSQPLMIAFMRGEARHVAVLER